MGIAAHACPHKLLSCREAHTIAIQRGEMGDGTGLLRMLGESVIGAPQKKLGPPDPRAPQA